MMRLFTAGGTGFAYIILSLSVFSAGSCVLGGQFSGCRPLSQLTNEVWLCLTGADLRHKVGEACMSSEIIDSLLKTINQQSVCGKDSFIPSG